MNTRMRVGAVALAVGLTGLTLVAQTPPAGTAAPTTPTTPATPPAQGRGGRGGAPTPSSCGPNPPAEMKNVARDSRCFELRTYTLRPGGAGDIDLLHARFRQHSIRLLQKHGMAILGFWQPVAKPDALTYLVAYKDAAARDAAWAAFQADPEWVKVRTDMNVGITVEATFMIATDYGMMK